MNDDKRLPDGGTLSESGNLKSRREFLKAAKGWSAAVIAGVALGGLIASEAEAGRAAWGNHGGGGRAAWGNHGCGGAAWGNRAGGGAA